HDNIIIHSFPTRRSSDLSVSQSLKEDTLRLFNIKKEIAVIPNFIDSSKYDHKFTDCQRVMMANEDEKIITHISNFREVKRIPDRSEEHTSELQSRENLVC